MTDTELKRLQAICEVANVDDIEDVSDGSHTFNDLYEQRMYLFAALVNAYKNKAWKSLKHEDGEYCFGGDWFIVGIDTPEGSYTYHYSMQYWDVFDCQILPRAKHWDGHTDKDVTRLMSLESKPNYSEKPNAPTIKLKRETGEWKPYIYVDPDDWYQDKEIRYRCSKCGAEVINESNFCPNCGADMRKKERREG